MKKKRLFFPIALFLNLLSLSSFGQAQFTADKFSGCSPLTVQFTETGSATSWDWNFGNGNTSCCSLKVVTAQYSTPGTYLVSLTINGGSTATHIITVFQSPVSTFVLDDDTTCRGGTITFTSTSTLGSAPIKTYTWAFGDGADSIAGSSISHSFTLPGTFSVNLVVTDTNGCTVASSQNTKVFIIAAPVPKFTMSPASSCNVPVTVAFNNQTGPGATSYEWTFGDPVSGSNDTSLLISPTHTYTALGQYTSTLTTRTGTCSSKDSTIFYAKQIVADFSTGSGSDTVCLNSAVLFKNTSNPPPDTALWNFGDPASGALNTSTLINPSHSFTASGTYSVFMIASKGCIDSMRKIIVVMPKPILSFITTDDSNYCKPPALIHFKSISNPSLASWQWTFIDTLNSFKDSIYSPDTLYSFSNYGHYSVKLIGIDIYGCSDTVTKLNYINIQAPTVNIITLPDSGCFPKPIQFTNAITLVTGDTVTKYFWNYGDGSPLDSTSGLNSVTHTYTACGIFDVENSIVTKKGCVVKDTKNGWARAGQKPTAGFSWSPSITCYGDHVQFTDTSKANSCPITAWNWDFGSKAQNPSWAFPDTGKWDVTLSVYSNGCVDAAHKDTIITVWPPKPIFIFSTPTCTNHDTVQFTDISHGADSIIWDFGDGSPKDVSNNKNPVHIFSGRGLYWVKLTAYNYTYGCNYTDSLPVIITAPLAIITGTQQGCYPFFTTLIGDSSVDEVTYSWNFGDPFTATNTSVLNTDTHRYVMPGTYAVKLIIGDRYGCTDDTTVIFHALGPIARAHASQLLGCRPLTDTLVSTSIPEGSPITQYLWNFNYPFPNDTAISFSDTIIHTFTQKGIHSIRLIAIDANGCLDDTILTNYIVVTFPDPQFNNIDTFVCDNTIVPFSVYANGTAPFTYSWNFGDGQPAVVRTNSPFGTDTVTHTYLSNNNLYKLSVTITDANGCDSTLSQNITVRRPDARFFPTQADTCQVTVPIYNAPTGFNITSWLWSINGPLGYTAGSAFADPSFQFTIPGRYYSTLTVTNPGCSDTYTDTTIVMENFPLAVFTYDSLKRCPPTNVKFTTHLLNNATYQYIEWDFGDGKSAKTNYPDSTISHTYYTGTFYPNATIYYKLKNGTVCDINSPNLSDSIIVTSTFSVNVTQDSIVIKEGHQDTLTSILTGGGILPYSYNWNTYATGILLPVYNTTSAIYTAMEHDTMIVLTLRDANGCEAYDTVFVDVKLCEVNLKIPNVFTPNNGDTLNDTYYINDLCDYSGFKATIYNRWGNVVYESSHFDFHWNGKDNSGKECSEGVYYYIINGKRQKLYGYIQLIRG